MKFDVIDLDSERMGKDLSKRERAAIYLLAIIFWIVAPSKFSHQYKNMIEQILT